MGEEWTHRIEYLPRGGCGRVVDWLHASGKPFLLETTKTEHHVAGGVGWLGREREGGRPLCCHLLEQEGEEREGREQILFACPSDLIRCGREDNKTLFSLLCA